MNNVYNVEWLEVDWVLLGVPLFSEGDCESLRGDHEGVLEHRLRYLPIECHRPVPVATWEIRKVYLWVRLNSRNAKFIYLGVFNHIYLLIESLNLIIRRQTREESAGLGNATSAAEIPQWTYKRIMNVIIIS